MIVRILNSMKKEIETIKNNQSEIKNAISEINDTLEGIKRRIDVAEDQISERQCRKKHPGRARKIKKN